jgi:hypothetical protein
MTTQPSMMLSSTVGCAVNTIAASALSWTEAAGAGHRERVDPHADQRRPYCRPREPAR